MSEPSVTLYTTPGCPDCQAVRAWLQQHHTPFTEHDMARPGVADEAKRRYGVRIAPITVINDVALYGTFETQLPKLREELGNSDTP